MTHKAWESPRSLMVVPSDYFSGISDAKTDDDVDYDRRICLICSESDEKLALFFLRAPEHLNGKLYHDLTMILSSFLISQDQEGTVW